jgi:N-acetylmuramoyl-L-alanine amidase
MFNKVLVACGCLIVVLSGCASEPMPQIVYGNDSEYQINEAAKPKPSAPTVAPAPSRQFFGGNAPASQDWLPPSALEKKWTAIIIHHSGTKTGDSAIFDKWHRENNHWNGVGYDFVIGNGTNSGDGQVEVTYRWQKQVTGAHVGGTPNNWANRDGIGICLVGDFNKSQPSNAQMQSLVKLVRFLQSRYGIPKSRIFGHGTTPGAHETDCPGRNFPMSWLKAQVLP